MRAVSAAVDARNNLASRIVGRLKPPGGTIDDARAVGLPLLPGATFPHRLAVIEFRALVKLLENRLGAHAVLKTLEIGHEFRASFLRKAVDHPIVMPSAFGHALGFQVGEMLGNLYLGLSENFLEMADAKRLDREQMEDAKAGFVTKAPVNGEQLHSLYAYI